MSNLRLLSNIAVLVTGLSAASGCIIAGGDDSEDGTDSEGGSPAQGGGPGIGGGPGSGGSGAAASGDHVGPSQDLVPEAMEPGPYACAGCPEAVIDMEDVDAGAETTFKVTGTVDGQSGQGQFLVINELGQFMGGGVFVDPDTGEFDQTVPLFCGESILKVYFSNASGTSAFVKRLTSSGCLQPDVRVTVAWDETTHHWTNHLVRFGGTIGDSVTDCHSFNNCYLGGGYADWGVSGDATDDPVMDTDPFYYFLKMGVENIYYPSAEDGLTVLIENRGVDLNLTPSGTLYISVHGQPTYVKQIAVLHPKELLIAAEVDGAAGTLTVIDEIYDCAPEWMNAACDADLP